MIYELFEHIHTQEIVYENDFFSLNKNSFRLRSLYFENPLWFSPRDDVATESKYNSTFKTKWKGLLHTFRDLERNNDCDDEEVAIRCQEVSNIGHLFAYMWAEKILYFPLTAENRLDLIYIQYIYNWLQARRENYWGNLLWTPYFAR